MFNAETECIFECKSLRNIPETEYTSYVVVCVNIIETKAPKTDFDTIQFSMILSEGLFIFTSVVWCLTAK